MIRQHYITQHSSSSTELLIPGRIDRSVPGVAQSRGPLLPTFVISFVFLNSTGLLSYEGTSIILGDLKIITHLALSLVDERP